LLIKEFIKLLICYNFSMKKDLHPKYGKMKVVCACGNEYEIYGTKEKINVEICFKCHPIFIGTEEKKAVIGQVEKFQRRYRKKQ